MKSFIEERGRRALGWLWRRHLSKTSRAMSREVSSSYNDRPCRHALERTYQEFPLPQRAQWTAACCSLCGGQGSHSPQSATAARGERGRLLWLGREQEARLTFSSASNMKSNPRRSKYPSLWVSFLQTLWKHVVITAFMRRCARWEDDVMISTIIMEGRQTEGTGIG